MFEKQTFPSQAHSSPVLLFARPPEFQDLCTVNVLVPNFTQSNPTASKFQPQTIKCREVIFTEPDVIGTPSFDIDNCFHLVMQQSLFKSGRLQARFQKHGLEMKKPIRVTPAIYQSCLRYTLLARIAPQWNKAGQWLIQGRDFLTHLGYADAVKLDLTVNTEELFFCLEAATIRFPILQIDDLDVCSTSLGQFNADERVTIKQYSIGLPWCHVLPSMKKGKVISVSHDIPENCPFKSYKDIKRHWKNTYGYRLPETEEDLLFYQVHFRPLGNTYYTYPDVCLRARDIQRVPRVDPKPILMAFLKDLHGKLPNICGMPLKLQTKANYPTLGLTEGASVDNGISLNLTTKNPAARKVVYRNRDDMQHVYEKQPGSAQNNGTNSSACKPKGDNSASGLGGNSSIVIEQSQGANNSMDLHHFRIADSYTSNSQQMRNKFISNANSVNVNSAHGIRHHQQSFGKTNLDRETEAEEVIPSSQAVSRFIPVFKTKRKDTPSCTQFNRNACTKTLPVFASKKKVPIVQSNRCFSQHEHENTNDQTNHDLFQMNGKLSTCTKTVPVFAAKKNVPFVQNSKSFSQQYGRHENTKFAGNDQTTHELFQIPSSESRNAVYHSESQRTPYRVHPVCSASPRTNSSSSMPRTPSVQQHYATPSNTPVTKSNSQRNTPTTDQRKRKNLKSIDATESTPKKARSKPQIQENIDIQLLALANQLNKVNTVTLVTWLKEKGVVCKSKDKKMVIIEKVKTFLNVTTSEQ
ncbi:hypothetical protein ScPMuIL_002003 [Solemya velum]